MTISIRSTTLAEDAQLLTPLSLAFGFDLTPTRVAHFGAQDDVAMRLGAFDGEELVGGAASWTFAMTTPGGVPVDVEGLTVVAVLATHRRRGVLTGLMRRHLDETRARGKSVAALYASEGSIYGRFGYGLASLAASIELESARSTFLGAALDPARLRFRLLDHDAAMRALPPIWERVRASTPGMLSRSTNWWSARRMLDTEWRREGGPALTRVLCELDGRPAGYALYRFGTSITHYAIVGALEVLEAVGDSPAATRAIWRYLGDVDLARTITADLLPLDHPLVHLVAEPTRLGLRLHDALWVRLVDVAAALSRRGWEAEGPPLVLGVEDRFCPWNQGAFRLVGGKAERADAAPDLTLGVDALGATYLGGFSFTQLAAAGRVVERTPGALLRADALFRSARSPWCPDRF